jgi:hypothetical protein
VIAVALDRNRELQQRLRAGLTSLNKASTRLADLRAQVESLRLKYKGACSPRLTCAKVSTAWGLLCAEPAPGKALLEACSLTAVGEHLHWPAPHASCLHTAGTRPGMVLPQATGASRFWRTAGRTPEPNADSVRLLPAYNYLPHVYGANNWSPAEQGDLQRAVLTVVQV